MALDQNTTPGIKSGFDQSSFHIYKGEPVTTAKTGDTKAIQFESGAIEVNLADGRTISFDPNSHIVEYGKTIESMRPTRLPDEDSHFRRLAGSDVNVQGLSVEERNGNLVIKSPGATILLSSYNPDRDDILGLAISTAKGLHSKAIEYSKPVAEITMSGRQPDLAYTM